MNWEIHTTDAMRIKTASMRSEVVSIGGDSKWGAPYAANLKTSPSNIAKNANGPEKSIARMSIGP